MNNKILIGSIIAVAVLVLVSFTGVVGYQTTKSSTIAKASPLFTVRSSRAIDGESKDIRAYIEMKSDEDCGCDDANTTGWNFPVICTLLYPLLIVSFILVTFFSNADLYHFMEDLARELNCYWANPNPEIGIY